MYAVNDAPERARWQVVWVNPNGKVTRHDCGDDFHEAMRVYTMAVRGDRRAVTLRSKNMTFPPPAKFRPRIEDILDKNGRPTGETIKHEPMHNVNRRGQWWCPFCIKFRAFRFRRGYYTSEGVWMEEREMVCPMCHVPHTSSAIKFWNPIARTITSAQLTQQAKARRRRKRRAMSTEED